MGCRSAIEPRGNPHGSLWPASRSVRVASTPHVVGLPHSLMCGLPRGPFAGRLKVPFRVASRSFCRLPRGLMSGLPRGLMSGLPRGPRKQTLRPKFSILDVFLALPTETSFITPHHYLKNEIWALEFFCGRIPLTLFNTSTPFCMIQI